MSSYDLIPINIKLRLKVKGIKQKALAERWGVTAATASKLLSGKGKIDAEMLFVSADILKCSVYDLLQPIHFSNLEK